MTPAILVQCPITPFETQLRIKLMMCDDELSYAYISYLNYIEIESMCFYRVLETRVQIWKNFQECFFLTNRFHVAVRLFSNWLQMTPKSGKKKKVAHEAIVECVTDILMFCLFWQAFKQDNSPTVPFRKQSTERLTTYRAWFVHKTLQSV